MRARLARFSLAVAALAVVHCGAGTNPPREKLGEAEVTLANVPTGVSCLRLTIADATRAEVRTFALTEDHRAVFRVQRLPVGIASFAADAFPASCDRLAPGVSPTWYGDAVAAPLNAREVAGVSLRMVQNGRASVGIEFDDESVPGTPPEPGLPGGIFSSTEPYLLPADPGVRVAALLTVGDSPNAKPDGTPYRLVGAPDGLGAFDNGDETFTLLVNHGLDANQGAVRAHGAPGAFVSKWIVRKADLAVLRGEDLMRRTVLWNRTRCAYDPPRTGVAFARFGSAELAEPGALYDDESGKGYDGRLLLAGERAGDESRRIAHAMDGTSYELPRLGKANWENSLANPGTGEKTVVLGGDHSVGGKLYVYLGTKTASGLPIERAGLTNGVLYGVRVIEQPLESVTTGIRDGAFDLAPFGNVENITGAELQVASVSAAVTGFQRPADGGWDPNDSNDFYFVTTAAFAAPSRLLRLHFVDASRPELGGIVKTLLDGSEGQRMVDGMAIDQTGHVLLLENLGKNDRTGKIWRYDINSKKLTLTAEHAPALFQAGSPTFLTNDETASGAIDATDILGAGWFLLGAQARFGVATELAQGGQLLALFDPASAG